MKRICLIFFVILGLLGNSLYAQERRVTGTVTDGADGSSLPGVTITVRGTTQGTITDANGQYELTVNEGDVLIFSFIGMTTEQRTVGTESVINVVMTSDIAVLEEVIITAGVAGATPRNKMSVTVNQVGAELLEAVPATSASSALQGKVAGATIVQASGNPGQASNIRLRGATSILGNSNPLIIVDGVMLEGDLADINVDDIENMEVVKGAAASALYGSRAGAGVVVITTKRGNIAAEGTTAIRIRNEYGMSTLPRKVPISQSHPYELAADWQDFNLFTKYAGVTFPEGYAGGADGTIGGNRFVKFDGYADNPFARYFDHQDLVFQDGEFFTNYISVAHNAGRTRIFTSFENSANSGIVWNTNGSVRRNFRLNADHWFGESLSFSSSTLISQSAIDVAEGRFLTGWGGGQGSAFFNMLFFDPDTDLKMDAPEGEPLPKYFANANHWQDDNANPLHALYYQDRELNRRNILQSIQSNYYATDWLMLNGNYSFERYNTFNSTFQPIGFNTGQAITQGQMYRSSNEGLSQTLSFTANVDEDFGDLTLRSRLQYMYEDFQQDFFSVRGSDLQIAGIRTLNNISTDGRGAPISSFQTIRSRNYSAIVDMDYLDRYIISALFRMDGSSLFGEDARWNPYYRISGAYRLAEEFDIPGVSELRLRASLGTSGQRPGFNYQYETFSVSSGSVSKATIGNKDLRPSETKELEFGLNAEFLDIFDLEVIYADIVTEGAFLNVPLPAASGFQFQWQNAADISAQVIEISLGAMVVNTPEFRWRTSFNFDRIRQEVTKLNAPAFRTGPTINALQAFYVREGEPFGMMYGGDWVTSLEQLSQQIGDDDSIDNYIINADGYVIQRGTEGTVNEAPIRLHDENGEDAFVRIADMNPDFNLTWNNTFQYRGLALNMLWHWKQGGDVYNQTKQWLYRDLRHGDFDMADKPANEKKVANYYTTFYRVNEPNSYFVEDGTYLKLREASLYYTFNAEQLGQFGAMTLLRSVRLGVIGRNLLTFTRYSGWDPEVAQVDYAESSSTNYFIDMFNYPNFRTLTFSLELNF